jgi:FtsZ-interacting cell division protein ZipA
VAHRERVLTATQRTVAGLAILFLIGAAFFGFLNSQKMKALRTTATNAETTREAAIRRELAAKGEAALAQVQKEKADLQATLDAKQQEIASLKKPVEEADKNSNAAATASPATADLQSQIDDLRHQLDSAEKEKGFLAAKLQDAQERGAPPKETKKQRETGAQRDTASAQREATAAHRTGVRGTVLAYNQAYNFVVLNLGARNGVETNAEMLVLRDGTLIGKIRISSVEPATAIGDILTNSLARGVQVQPGDTVIYAGTNP